MLSRLPIWRVQALLRQSSGLDAGRPLGRRESGASLIPDASASAKGLRLRRTSLTALSYMRERVGTIGAPATDFLRRASAPMSAKASFDLGKLVPFGSVIRPWRQRFFRPRADRRLTQVLTSICPCSFTLDRDWRFTSATPDALEWVQIRECDLIGFDMRDVLPVPTPLRRAIELGLSTGKASSVEIAAVAHPGRRAEFQIRPFAEGVTVLFRDVTERSRTGPGEAEAVGATLGEIAEARPAALAMLNESGLIVAVNAAWQALLPGAPASPSGDVGRSYLKLCERIFPDADHATIRRGLEDLLSGAREVFSHAHLRIEPDGSHWRRMRISRLPQQDPVRFVAIQEDVTDLARAEESLHALAEQLEVSEQHTRQQIAIELHDSTSQHLVGLGLGLARLRGVTGGSGEYDGILSDMSQSLAEAVKEVRVLSYLMSPPNVAEAGLEAAARRYVQGVGLRTGLRTDFQAERGLARVEAPVEHAAFRVLQEALANVYRHADASSVEVSLSRGRDGLTLRIADDGKGIGRLEAGMHEGARLGVGIPGMRARVAQLGGALDIAGGETGTVVTATFPTIVAAAQATNRRDQGGPTSRPAPERRSFG